MAYETIRDALCQACGARAGEPGYVGAIQTFGDLMGWHSHIHAIVSEGLFKRDGFFIRITKVDMERCAEMWRERLFDLLLREEKIDEEVVRSMRGWPHSGFGKIRENSGSDQIISLICNGLRLFFRRKSALESIFKLKNGF